MPDSLLQLEAQRTDLFRRLAAPGDLRRGSHHFRQVRQTWLPLLQTRRSRPRPQLSADS